MPPAWNAAQNEPILLLAGLLTNPDKTSLAVRKAGLDPDEVGSTGVPKVFCLRVVEEDNRRDAVAALLRVAHQDFPELEFYAVKQQLRQPAIPNRPRLNDAARKAPTSAVGGPEKGLGAQAKYCRSASSRRA
jgi:hypothetical protein